MTINVNKKGIFNEINQENKKEGEKIISSKSVQLLNMNSIMNQSEST